MTFSIFITFTVYQLFICHLSHGFEVIQPESRTVNPDGSATISCKHTSNGIVKDVRLNHNSKLLCQRGMPKCESTAVYKEDDQTYVFILLNIRPEQINSMYVCEFTLEENGLDVLKHGKGTKLLQGQETKEKPYPSPSPALPPPPPPPPLSSVPDPMMWILIGLLASMFLYSVVITCCFIRLTISQKVCEDPTYVEMRKTPLSYNPNSYHMQLLHQRQVQHLHQAVVAQPRMTSRGRQAPPEETPRVHSQDINMNDQ